MTTYYNTRNGVIISQSDGTNTMYFQYDMNGLPIGFIFNGTQYFYMTNQMGDIIAITESDGNIIAQYVYDEWGKLLNIYTVNEDSAEQIEVANANPLRYRGYYYDTETGYYYLQSRYYDASICRFINADIPEIAQMSKGISSGTNLFAYCNNNPINDSDPTGQAGIQSILSVLGNAISTVENILELIANTCKKELNRLKNISRSMAKSNSRSQKKLLKNTINETEKSAKKLGKIGKIVASVAIVIGIIEAIKSGASLLFVVIRFLAELITEAISFGINKICQLLASAIPGVGFIVKIVVSIGASYLLSRYFSDRRINNIAYAIKNYIGSRSRRNINKKDLLKVALRKAFC